MDELLRFNGQLYKRVDNDETETKVDRMHDGNPENAKELAADLVKCKKIQASVKKLKADLESLEYDIGSLSISSKGLIETTKGLDLISKELLQRENELSKMKF